MTLVRHAQTWANIKRVLQKPTDGGVTEKGRRQAKLLARRLVEKEKFDCIYIADSERVMQTSFYTVTPVMGKVAIYHREDICEQNVGIHTGRNYDEYRQLIVEAGTPHYEYKPIGGESLRETQERALCFYQEMYREHHSKNVLVFSSGTFIVMLLMAVFDIPFSMEEYDRLHVRNTALTIIDHIGKDPILEAHDDVAHLGKLI